MVARRIRPSGVTSSAWSLMKSHTAVRMNEADLPMSRAADSAWKRHAPSPCTPCCQPVTRTQPSCSLSGSGAATASPAGGWGACGGSSTRTVGAGSAPATSRPNVVHCPSGAEVPLQPCSTNPSSSPSLPGFPDAKPVHVASSSARNTADAEDDLAMYWAGSRACGPAQAPSSRRLPWPAARAVSFKTGV